MVKFILRNFVNQLGLKNIDTGIDHIGSFGFFGQCRHKAILPSLNNPIRNFKAFHSGNYRNIITIFTMIIINVTIILINENIAV